MKAYFLWTVTGPKLVATSADFVEHPEFLRKLADKGIKKFVAQEVPLELVQERFREQYRSALTDPKQTDQLRFVATEGEHVLNSFSFAELGDPIYYQSVVK